jgi:hypothetical protein
MQARSKRIDRVATNIYIECQHSFHIIFNLFYSLNIFPKPSSARRSTGLIHSNELFAATSYFVARHLFTSRHNKCADQLQGYRCYSHPCPQLLSNQWCLRCHKKWIQSERFLAKQISKRRWWSLVIGGRTEPRSKNFAPKMSLDFGAPLFLTFFLTYIISTSHFRRQSHCQRLFYKLHNPTWQPVVAPYQIFHWLAWQLPRSSRHTRRFKDKTRSLVREQRQRSHWSSASSYCLTFLFCL